MTGFKLTMKNDFSDKISIPSFGNRSNKSQNAGMFFRNIDAITRKNWICTNPFDLLSSNGIGSHLIGVDS